MKSEDTVFIDQFYRKKLGVREVGEMVEINGHRACIAGFTRGIRSFTTLGPNRLSHSRGRRFRYPD